MEPHDCLAHRQGTKKIADERGASACVPIVVAAFWTKNKIREKLVSCTNCLWLVGMGDAAIGIGYEYTFFLFILSYRRKTVVYTNRSSFSGNSAILIDITIIDS